jgi:hypothetical protein
MPFATPRLASLVGLLLAAAVLPAAAESLVGSSVAGGSSASSAGSSASEKSSNSSSKNNKVAEGPYRIIDVAQVPERPGQLRLRLQAAATPGVDGELMLYLPEQTYARSGLAAGQDVTARQRPYGMEFARADTQQAFFLVLGDDWMRELPANPVVL